MTNVRILVGQRNLWIDTWRFTTGQHQNISAMNVITSVMMEAISKFTDVWNMTHWCSLVQSVTTRPNLQGVWGLTTKSTLLSSYVRTHQTKFQCWRWKVHLVHVKYENVYLIHFNIYQLDYIIVLNQPQAITSFNKLTVVRIVIFFRFFEASKGCKGGQSRRVWGCPWSLVLGTQYSELSPWYLVH